MSAPAAAGAEYSVSGWIPSGPSCRGAPGRFLTRHMDSSPVPHVDVLIVGAGLSGIGAACHLRDASCPARAASRSSRRASAIGGTWDLFRYPGVRSDSDMFTLGYRFRPWTDDQAHRRRAVDPRLRRARRPRARRRRARSASHHRVRRRRLVLGRRRAGRSTAEHDGVEVDLDLRLPVRVLAATTTTTRATPPDFPGVEDFAGQVVHPQHWPEDLDYAGKRVVVIGSGATAVTLVPAMAGDRRARDDAAALADATSMRAPGAATRSPTGCGRCCRRSAAYARHPVEEHPASASGFYQLEPAAPGARCAG